MSASTPTSERAFVLGLDGVPWRLIERWSDGGELENFATLREEGASGPLESTVPPTTPLAWPSIATGVWPDKHGIYGFQNLSASYTHRMHTSRDLKQSTLWEQLSPALVGNVPMTYPPDEIDGAIVSGMMTPSTSDGYTYPPSLADEIAERVPDYRISLNYPEFADTLDEFPAAVEEMLANRQEVMRLLMERTDDWRLFFFVFTAPDRFQHLIWDDQQLLSLYRLLDELLGEVMAYTDEHGADLYVVSDHGFGEIDMLVYVNYLLEQEGYLNRREDEGTRRALSSLGISRNAVSRALNALGISEEMIISALPRTIVDSVAEQIPGQHALYDVDYKRTVAFVHDAGNLYINDTNRFEDGFISPREIPGLKDELTDFFESVTDPRSDEPVLRVFDGDELFPTDDASPDLIVNGRDGYESRNAIADEAFGDPTPTAASHRSRGIMLCRGPGIEPGAALRGARVVDVAPTLLHGIDEPVPVNADGRVLFDAFSPDSVPAKTKVRRVDVSRTTDQETVEDDFTDVENRLKGLGYME